MGLAHPRAGSDNAGMVRVEPEQIERFADFFQSNQSVKAFDFCGVQEGVLFPSRGQPGVIDYFFFCTAHQFGFWHLAGDRYDRPMIATLDGVAYKGSDYIWRAATRRWLTDPTWFEPARLAQAGDADLERLFTDDTGTNPLPMWDANLRIIHAYASWFVSGRTSPVELVAEANAAPRSLEAFLRRAGQVPGYCEDTFQKKLQLLAVILENRPEHFLRVTDPDSYRPIIDYHLQRSALRTGLVSIKDAGLLARLEARVLVSREEERVIRLAVFDAIAQLVEKSGASVAAIDYFFFMNRTRCPEMTEPKCPECPVRDICVRATRLFQPVLRTTDY